MLWIDELGECFLAHNYNQAVNKWSIFSNSVGLQAKDRRLSDRFPGSTRYRLVI